MMKKSSRMALAALVVFLFCLYRDSRGKGDPETGDGVPFRQMTASQKKTLLLGGAFCSLALAVASALQQIGIEQGTSAGKAGFITAMYILFVPLGELLIFRKKLRWLLLPAVLLSHGLIPAVHEGGRGADAGGRRRHAASVRRGVYCPYSYH